MAQKISKTKSAQKKVEKQSPKSGKTSVSTPVRNTPLPKIIQPKKIAPATRIVTSDMIAEQAYYIAQSGVGGSETDNWLRAERELAAGI